MQTKPTLYLLLNHPIIPEQEQDAFRSLGVGHIEYLPDSLLTMWKAIPSEYPFLKEFLMPHAEYLVHECKKGDYVLIHGDPGATYLMVQKASALGLKPIYSTTTRTGTKEITDERGRIIKTSIFQHVRYRAYGA